MFPHVTVDIDLKDRGMVDDSVNGRYGHQRVGEYLIPMAKRLVRSNDQIATFVTMGNQFKQHLRSLSRFS